VTITLVYAGKYRTEDKLKMTEKLNKQLNTTQKANNTKHSKRKLPWFSRLFGQEARWANSTSNM